MDSKKWFYSRSRVRWPFKKPAKLDPRLEGYFYTGPSNHFGHMPPKKGNKKK